MYQINAQGLIMLQGELEKEVQLLMQSLEDAEESIDGAALEARLSSLRGIFRLLELPGAEALLDTLLAVGADANTLQVGGKGAHAIHHALQCLPGYLKQVQRQGTDSVLLLLPELNELRAVLKQPPLDERIAVGEFIPKKPPLGMVKLRDEGETEVVCAVRRLFQQGLVHAIKGGNRDAAIKVMAHGVHRLRKTLADPAERDYWSLVFEILSAMHRGTLGFEQNRLKTLMAVERQLRMMEENADATKFYPPDLQMTLLAYFSLSGLRGDGAVKLAARLGVQSPGYTSRDILASRDMFIGDGTEALSLLVATAAGQAEHLSQLLDQGLAGNEADADFSQELSAGVQLLGELCSQCDLKLASQRCDAHVAGIARVQTGPLPMELYERLADTLLYLECVLTELQSQPISESRITQMNTRSLKQVVEDNIVEHAERKVLRETADHLASVMQMTSDYCDGIAGDEVAEPLVENFKQVLGPMGMLGLHRAEKVARRCLAILNRSLTTTGSGVSLSATMAIFADAIVSLEYYLQNRRWNRNFDDAVLSVAEDCLLTLESA
ncbi:hypothetical protein [Porticoccus sp.]